MSNVILSSGDGRRFLVAQLMDSLGAGLSSVVLPWLVLDAGGSGAEAGAAFLVGTVPYVLLGLPAGDIGDRRPRRRVMELGVTCQLLAALVIDPEYSLAKDNLALLAETRRTGLPDTVAMTLPFKSSKLKQSITYIKE